MFDIKDATIKNWTNNIVYRRGLDLYSKGKVKRLDVVKKLNDTYKFNVTTINALVESSQSNILYEVQVMFNDKTGVMHVGCDCKSFEKFYKNDSICKHVAAALSKYTRENNSAVDLTYKMRTKTLIENLKNTMFINEDFTSKELNIKPKFSFKSEGSKEAFLELKVGEDNLYVVKSIREFILALKNKNRDIEFGKKFTYKPGLYKVKDEDKALINLLIELLETDERNRSQDYYYKNEHNFLNGKKAYLTNSKLKRFLDNMKGKSFEAVIKGNNYGSIKIIEDRMPLSFNLEKSNEKIVLQQEGKLPIPLTGNGEYFFYNENIYKVDEQQSRIYMTIYNAFLLEKQSSLKFNMADVEKVASYIIPSLKNIGSVLQVEESLEKNFYEEPLIVSVYLDKNSDIIEAIVAFNYGEVQINPYGRNQDDAEGKVIIRDINKEFKITKLLENFGFTVQQEKLILVKEEHIIDFLVEGIDKLQQSAEVYYSDSFKNMKIYPSRYSAGIRLNDEDLLEFTFTIEGVDREELKNIFEALREKKKYYKLKKGGFIDLQGRELNNLNTMLEYLDIKDSQLQNEKIIMPKYNALYMDESFKINSMDYVERNKTFRDLVSSIRDVKQMEFTVPEHLKNIMREYQKAGFKWLKTIAACGFGGILADEMGLGKTLQAISFIASDIKKDSSPYLVVAPTSLVYNWKSEIEKFSPELNVQVIAGNKEDRKKTIEEINNYDVLITSYPLIRRDIFDYESIKFKYCFLDEAQQIKNPNSINAKAVKEIKAEGYFALTGTPIENSLTELWSIFDFIMPGYLMSHNKFMKKYETQIVKNNDEVALAELNKHIKPFILRRLKSEVIKELPPKIEYKIAVEMTEEQKKVYAAYLSSAKEEISSEIKRNGFEKSKIKILSVLTRLRQICCEPSVFIENFEGDSGKMLALDDTLEGIIEEGHRVLIFSQFTTVLKRIGERIAFNNIKYMYLDGQTKMEERSSMVKEFNEGNVPVFLISLKAGGTGLNLTGADTVIHFDPWWNPAVEDQASDRAHRIGQKKTVEVIKLIARGTIEEKIYNLQEKKREIINSVMDENNNERNTITQMSQEELEEILRS